jgi:threonine/homoserine/homoserine lactone efflux protein
MLFQHPLILAVLTGFVSGLLLSIPVGPVNLTIINEGAREGLLWALLIGFGATAMEVIYCALAFTGFASLFNGKVIKAILEVFSFVFMLYLGIKFMRVRTIASIAPGEAKLKGKLNPHSAFAIGFVRVMGNPGVFLFWIVLAALFRSHDWVEPTIAGTCYCVLGVAAGTGLWFFTLSYMVSTKHGKFTEKTLLRMEHGSGICLLLLAIGQGIHMIWQLAHHTL